MIRTNVACWSVILTAISGLPALAEHDGSAAPRSEGRPPAVEPYSAVEPYWAYAPIARPVPSSSGSDSIRNEIDAFVARRLAREGVQPASEADRVTLLRRLSFDITGLPPTPQEVRDFVADDDPDAIETVVDRLLASPHYGERMAMAWLDLVRYADTVGYHGDQEIRVSPFRDYVINAFNDNMPFDQFTREQLGGDLIPDATLWQKVASGYNRLGMMSAEGGVQPKEYLAKYAAERVRNVSLVWMGATVGCAECHVHKFDPYTMDDFYSLASFFADIQERGIYGGAHESGNWGPSIALPTPEQEAKLKEVDKRIAALEARVGAANEPQSKETTPGEANSDETAPSNDQAALTALKEQKKTLVKSIQTTHITVAVEPRVMRVLPRGNWMDESGQIVQPAVPNFLRQIDTDGRADRLDLAEWIVADDNPLTARVFVNRLWKIFFGYGIVRSLDDFGKQGTPPTHPELLDWLAAEFIESGWDVKHMAKRIVMSATYRQSSQADQAVRASDPYNTLFARQSRFRLDAEMVRDNALSVSGLLVRQIGGRSAKPYQPAGYYAHLNFPKRSYQPDSGDNLWRRSIYTHWQRFLHPSLMAFDAPSREECCVERPRSNTPLAALVLLNDPIYVEAARVLAERVLREAPRETAARVQFAYQETLSRGPRPEEVELIGTLHARSLAEFRPDPQAAAALIEIGERPTPQDIDPAELAAWTCACRAIINTHEFITRN